MKTFLIGLLIAMVFMVILCLCYPELLNFKGLPIIGGLVGFTGNILSRIIFDR